MISLRSRIFVKRCYLETKFLHRFMLTSVLLLGMSACSSSGDWREYNYGPADWLAERKYGEWDSMYSYKKFAEPDIEIHYVDNLTNFCGSIHTLGCARFGDSTCHIWIGKNAPLGTLDHEKRHCHGWRHPQRETSLSYNKNTNNDGQISNITIWSPMAQFL